jgi:hypothetical protein
MELLSPYDQGVADLATDNMDDLLTLHIIEDAEVAHPELELGDRIGLELLDGPGRCRRPVAEPGEDCGLHDPLLSSWQGLQLRLGLRCRLHRSAK